MDNTEEYVSTLLNMGFPNEMEIRRALRMSKNELNDAITILTSGSPVNYDGFEDLDIEMKDIQRPSQYSSPPPNYDDVVDPGFMGPKENPQNNGAEVEDNPLEFPVPNLIELENRVFTESWSIPYKKEESLGKCLLAATRLAEEGLCESDTQCKRFLEKCLPECFSKLLTAAAVHRWGSDIQEGVFDMMEQLVDFVAARLKYEPVPVDLLETLALSFLPESEYHTKNRSRQPDKNQWEEKLEGKLFAVSPAQTYKDPYGWLVNMVNRFAYRKGFELIQERLNSSDLDAPAFAALIAPFGSCAQYLNKDVVKPLLEPGLKSAVAFVQNLKSDDLKQKKVISVCSLLVSIKKLSLYMWPDDDEKLDLLRLSFVLRMLKSPHFNARMNALKEITKMIEDSTGNKETRTAICHDTICKWLVDNKVLSVALEGNIDQAQYCDKVKNIVDFLGTSLSVEELTKIWKMQQGQSNLVIDNIHSIIVAAAVKFGTPLLDHLFKLIQKSWETEHYKMREKLIVLVGQIGKDTRIQKTTLKVLDLLWDLSHVPQLSTSLMEQALDEHLTILSDAYTVREEVKRKYVNKCVEDIKEGKWVLPALKQLLQITKNIAKNSFHKAEKPILQDLNKNYDIIKQVVLSLTKFHQLSIQICKDQHAASNCPSHSSPRLNPDTIIDGRYTHKEYVNVHLQLLQFILEVGSMYLHWKRASDLWSHLVAKKEACDWDRETCFEWFTKGISDLEKDTQVQLFQKEFLRLDPMKLTTKGFTCYKTYFENVNEYEHRLKRNRTIYFVEKVDLVGMDFLWEVCLNTQDAELSETAISMLIDMAYVNLAYRLKKDPEVLHKKFINECYNRLESAMNPGGRALHQLLSDASRILASVGVPQFGSVPCPARTINMLNIERVLLIAEKYITTVEESHLAPRTILPHGASFQGNPMTLYVTCESPKMDFNIKVHSNQSVGAVRLKVASKLKLSADNLQIVHNDQVLSKDQKLLHQVLLEDRSVLSARAYSHTSSSTTDTSSTVTLSSKQSFDQEQEKMFPGVVMASGGQVFDMLYQLSDLDEPKITNRARSLLKLIPTDASVQDALDGIARKSLRQATPEPPSPKASPRPSSPKKSSQVSPAPTDTPPLTPREVLKNLYNTEAQGMSTFRVLYNLEVLSSKLMPTTHDITILHSAHSFCESFLNAGGLELVVDVLHRDSIPQEVDYETRQGCYVIALQLLRYLLCGQEVTGDVFHVSARDRRSSTSSGGLAVPGSSASTGSGPPSIEFTPSAASKAVQTMGLTEFTNAVACFMRVAWAAAAGKLYLASSSQPIKDSGSLMTSSAYSTGSSRSRQSSTGSTNSSGSESDPSCLHPGVCVKQTKVSTKDANIAQESLELLVTCLQLRSPLLASFYSLAFVSDFIIDILVGSPNQEVREVALDQFYLLSQTEVTPSENLGHQQSPHFFMLHTLLKARLPFWVSSSSIRGSSHRLLKQCSQYFDLRCRLLTQLSEDDQKRLAVDVDHMLEDEIGWLQNFVPSENEPMMETDNMLIAGHLKLIRTLVTCQGVDKRKYGQQLIKDLLHDFLFPSSMLVLNNTNTVAKDSSINHKPKCSDARSRVAAYELLVEVGDSNLRNLEELCREVTHMHHQVNPDIGNQWEYMPPVDGRSRAGFVGLRNGGATCYMNSVIQQLYMTPGVKEAILNSDDEATEEDSVFFQLQQIFGHLLDSKLQYYVPEKFWNVFKLWGQTVNIREQQDALDFYQAVIDQVDEHLKKLGKESIFKKKFQGVYSDQKICKDCPHRYEREEIFYALNVTVKNATLQDSLAQFVKGELLEGDNAYFCEKCGEKRNTVKRMCIKTLPPVLWIQLKRFGFDWEANRALKFDDHFKFPRVLDMEPYTSEGMVRRETTAANQTLDSSSSSLNEELEDSTTSSNSPGGVETLAISCVPNTPSKQVNYRLVGAVIHSGQATAGHYYSFIEDRRGSRMSNPAKGHWYKFNDTDVQDFDMTETALEEECFGGSYKAKVYEQSSSSSSYPEERLRYWNAYLLIYERMDAVRTPNTAKKSKLSIRKSFTEKPRSFHSSTRRNSDSLVELTELVHKGEKKGLFQDKMPADIQRVVREENLNFMRNRDVYCIDYFRFLRQVVNRNTSHLGAESYSDLALESLQLAIKFFFNTYLRTKRKLRNDMGEWVSVIEEILQQCKAASVWFVEYLSSSEGRSYLKPFLLECPSKEIRSAFGHILESTIKSYFSHGGMPLQKCFDEFLETILHMLNKDVPDHCKHCTQYFQVLFSYAQMDTRACSHMFGRRAFQRLALFLLGDAPINQNNEQQENNTRRWSSQQSRDFGALHETMATLVLNCDVSQFTTEEKGTFTPKTPTTIATRQVLLKMSAEMRKFSFGDEAHRYLREVVLALREVPTHLSRAEDMLLYCSFCNSPFSMTVLKNIMIQYTSAPSNELKGLLSALQKLLLLEDPLQLKRLKCVIDGYLDEYGVEYEGMLAVIKIHHQNDSRRSYQCIKFLVNLSNKSKIAKDYLMQSSTKWSWAVNWLKKKMSENYWTPTVTTLSNESSDSKLFQRTVSAQGTLEEATALLTDFEAQFSDMETNGQAGSEASGQLDDDQDTEPLEEEEGVTTSLRTEGEGNTDPQEVVKDMGLDSGQSESQRL